MRPNAKVCRGNEDLANERKEPDEKREHGRYEEERHEHRCVETDKGSHEHARDDRADEERGNRTEGDRVADELGTPGKGLKLGVNACSHLRRTGRELGFEHATAIDDTRQSARENREHRADAREQKHGRDGQLDRMRDGGDASVLLHFTG